MQNKKKKRNLPKQVPIQLSQIRCPQKIPYGYYSCEGGESQENKGFHTLFSDLLRILILASQL